MYFTIPVDYIGRRARQRNPEKEADSDSGLLKITVRGLLGDGRSAGGAVR